jgi:hypothetical protein
MKKITLILGLFALLISHAGISSSLTYFKAITGFKGKQAKEYHKQLRAHSKKLSFLDCPIEMIERQWGGANSVNLGMRYLEQFLAESQKAESSYADIINECSRDLELYKNQDRMGKIRSRAIVGAELESFMASTNIQNQALFNHVANAINQETRCYAQRLGASIGYLGTGTIGIHQLECYTPLGRRILFRGPALGMGVGYIANIWLPNIDSLNPAIHSMLLYQQEEKKVYHLSKGVFELALGGGMVIEHDMSRYFRQKTDGQNRVLDLKGAIGAGITVENVHSFMFRKDLSPLYIWLSDMNDLGQMAQTVK